MTTAGLAGADDNRRMLILSGARNVRDLGGYPAADGRRVRWGRLYRAAELNTLTEGDLEILADRRIKTFVDFRRRQEIAESPDRRPASLDGAVSLPVDPGDFTAYARTVGSQPGAEVMAELYRIMVRDFHEVFAEFLALAAQEQRGPILFHCAAGKDRTGIAAALLLAALGADHDTIFQDYLLSNIGLGDKYAEVLKARPELAPAVAADASYLEAAFEVIDREFDGLEAFLERRLRANRTALQALYLEE